MAAGLTGDGGVRKVVSYAPVEVCSVVEMMEPMRPMVRSTAPLTRPRGPTFQMGKELERRAAEMLDKRHLAPAVTAQLNAAARCERKVLKAQNEYERERRLARMSIYRLAKEDEFRWLNSSSPFLVDLHQEATRAAKIERARSKEARNLFQRLQREKREATQTGVVPLTEGERKEEERVIQRTHLSSVKMEHALKDVMKSELSQMRSSTTDIDVGDDGQGVSTNSVSVTMDAPLKREMDLAQQAELSASEAERSGSDVETTKTSVAPTQSQGGSSMEESSNTSPKTKSVPLYLAHREQEQAAKALLTEQARLQREEHARYTEEAARAKAEYDTTQKAVAKRKKDAATRRRKEEADRKRKEVEEIRAKMEHDARRALEKEKERNAKEDERKRKEMEEWRNQALARHLQRAAESPKADSGKTNSNTSSPVAPPQKKKRTLRQVKGFPAPRPKKTVSQTPSTHQSESPAEPPTEDSVMSDGPLGDSVEESDQEEACTHLPDVTPPPDVNADNSKENNHEGVMRVVTTAVLLVSGVVATTTVESGKVSSRQSTPPPLLEAGMASGSVAKLSGSMYGTAEDEDDDEDEEEEEDDDFEDDEGTEAGSMSSSRPSSAKPPATAAINTLPPPARTVSPSVTDTSRGGRSGKRGSAMASKSSMGTAIYSSEFEDESEATELTPRSYATSQPATLRSEASSALPPPATPVQQSEEP